MTPSGRLSSVWLPKRQACDKYCGKRRYNSQYIQTWPSHAKQYGETFIPRSRTVLRNQTFTEKPMQHRLIINRIIPSQLRSNPSKGLWESRAPLREVHARQHCSSPLMLTTTSMQCKQSVVAPCIPQRNKIERRNCLPSEKLVEVEGLFEVGSMPRCTT